MALNGEASDEDIKAAVLEWEKGTAHADLRAQYMGTRAVRERVKILRQAGVLKGRSEVIEKRYAAIFFRESGVYRNFGRGGGFGTLKAKQQAQYVTTKPATAEDVERRRSELAQMERQREQESLLSGVAAVCGGDRAENLVAWARQEEAKRFSTDLPEGSVCKQCGCQLLQSLFAAEVGKGKLMCLLCLESSSRTDQTVVRVRSALPLEKLSALQERVSRVPRPSVEACQGEEAYGDARKPPLSPVKREPTVDREDCDALRKALRLLAVLQCVGEGERNDLFMELLTEGSMTWASGRPLVHAQQLEARGASL